MNKTIGLTVVSLILIFQLNVYKHTNRSLKNESDYRDFFNAEEIEDMNKHINSFKLSNGILPGVVDVEQAGITNIAKNLQREVSALFINNKINDEDEHSLISAAGNKSDLRKPFYSDNSKYTPLAGDYTIGMSMFNKVTGKKITFERKVKKVFKEVYEFGGETNGSDKSELNDPISFSSSAVKKILKEVDEVFYIPTENGLKYEGKLFASREEYPGMQSEAGSGVYATITAAITDLNARGINGPVRFLLLDASYSSATESYPIIINSIDGSSDTNTVTIRPQTGVTSVISGNVSGAMIKFNGADNVIIDGSNSGGSDRSLTIIDSSSTGIGIWIASDSTNDGAMFNTIKNCKISGLSHVTTFAGIFSGSGISFGGEAESPNSNLTIHNNEITKVQNAIYLRGNSVNADTAMTISDNTLGTASANLGFRGVYIGNSENFNIHGNVISNVISYPSSTETMHGIQIGENISGGNIFKNKISTIKQINTSAGWGAAGILLGAFTSLANVTVYNNFISDVKGFGYPDVNSYDNGYGIMVESGGGYNIYFNTVSMNTNQTNTNGITAALNVSSAVSTSNSVNVRNNIFSNTQTIGSNRYCVYSGASASVYSDINYNDYYYASNPNLGYLGGNRANLITWQTATGDDLNSISGNPRIFSSTDLHIDTAVYSPCRAGAIVISGITDDIDGNSRNVSKPDIGADEINVQPLAGDYTIGAVLFNSITGRKITFEKTVIKVVKESYENADETDGRDKSNFQNSESVLKPNMKKTAKEVDEIICVPMENGSRYEGPLFVSKEDFLNMQADAGAGVYATITAAVTDLNYKGVSAPVRFLLLDANYTSATETYPLTINPISGSSAINTVTIRPATGITSLITGNNSASIFKINGADYFIIDGSNSGGSDRSLTIIDSNSAGSGIWLASASANDGANFNTIKNCKINGQSQFTSFAGIVSGSGTIIGNESAYPNSNLSIVNNEITKFRNAIYLIGNSSLNDSLMTVSGNTLGSISENLGMRGILIGNSKNFNINGNIISGIISSSSSIDLISGIQTSLNINGGRIYNNKISGINQTNTGGYAAAGILLKTLNSASDVSVYNNFISDIIGYGDANPDENGNGIRVDSGGGYNIYFNTVSLKTEQSNPASVSAALYISGNVTISGALNIKNNIFSNTQTIGTERYCVYSGGTASVYSGIDNNDYYFASNPNLGYLGGNHSTLSGWKSATGKDSSSISGNPMFADSADLHIDLHSASPCNSAGVPVSGISDDIDGNARDSLFPDIGADEYNPGMLAGNYLVGVSMFNSVTGKSITFNRIVRKVTKEVYESYEEKNGKSKSNILDANSISGFPIKKVLKETDEITFVPMLNGKVYDGSLFVSKENFPDMFADSIRGIYATISAAVADLNSRGVSGAVRFLLIDTLYTSASETYPLTINQIAGSSSINTVTFRPYDGISSKITGNNADGIFKLNDADFIIIDGSNSGGSDRSLTLIDSNSSGAGIWIGGASGGNGATSNTIRNCRIKGLSQFTTFAGIFSGSGISFESETGSMNTNLSVINNEITNVQNAIYIRGSSVSLDSAAVISGNELGKDSGNLGYRGIFIGNSRMFRIYNNVITGVISSPSSSAIMQGIQVGNNIDGGNIYNNKISKIKQTNSPIGWGAAGILLGASSAASNILVYNNFISDVTGYGFGDVNSYDNGYGIMIEKGGGYSLFYNTVSMNTDQINPNGIPSALNISSDIQTMSSIAILNNIFSNTQTIGANRYCIYSGASASVYSDINYNDYHHSTSPNLGYLGGNRASLSNWRIASGKDTNSISADPLFAGINDLHIDSIDISPCNDSGVFVPGINFDIDGNIRDSINPDIGADEFNLFHKDAGVTNIIYPFEGINALTSDTVVPVITIKNFGNINLYTPFNITCIINPGGYISTISDTLSAGLERNVTFTAGFIPSPNTTYTITVFTSLEGDRDNSNDTLEQTSSFINVKPKILSFYPESGAVGTKVVIKGKGFSNVVSNNVVLFGAVRAEIISADEDSISVSVPAGANYEFLSVTNLDSNLTGYSTKPFIVTFSGGCKPDFAPVTGFSTGAAPNVAKIGDIDSDGKSDLVSLNKSGNSISVLRNISDTSGINFEPKIDFSTGGTLPDAMSLADIDGDGRLDIITGDTFLSVFINTSDTGNISFAIRKDFSASASIVNIEINDFNGDGKPDIAYTTTDSLEVLKNISDSVNINFAAASESYVVSGNSLIESGDIDGDGKHDIIAYNGINSVVLRNNSSNNNLSFTENLVSFSGNTLTTFQIGLSDIDADGKHDLVFCSEISSLLYVYKNTSAIGVISFDVPYNFNFSDNTGSLTIGDYDGDGKPDVAAGSDSLLHLIINNSIPGNISFFNHKAYPSLSKVNLYNGDLSEDGKPEIVSANEAGNAIDVFKNLSASAQLSAAVYGNGALVINGSVTPDTANHTDFGIVSSDTSAVRTYILHNLSSDSLMISNILMTGGDSAMFFPDTLNTILKIAAGDSAAFDVTFIPSSAGVKSSVVKIITSINSGTECFIAQDYTFAVRGTGTTHGIINISLIQEGFYNTAVDRLRLKDTVKAYLHSSISPYEAIDSAVGLIDTLTFTDSFIFPNAGNGIYYIKIKHRNTIETWSKSGGEVFTEGTTMNYDFTITASQALGNNQKQVASFIDAPVPEKNILKESSVIRFGIYSGDVNQDGVIDASDLSLIDNDAVNFLTGYYSSDVNGDDNVDGNDLSITDNNASDFINAVVP